MDIQNKTMEELISELQELLQENNSLKALKEKEEVEFSFANKELVFQNDEKEKRAAELVIANKELAFQNDEKEKRAAELIIANKELAFQNDEKGKRADELIIANKELAFQNDEKEKRAAELIIANKELAFQNDEKEKRADELIIANKELAFQNDEKEKRADELIIANKELAFQNDEKGKRADELIIANDEVAAKSKEISVQNEYLNQSNIELIQSKEKAEESDRLKSAFLANMSHEIRTPMNGILGFTELLKEPNLSGEDQHEYIQIIEKSGVRLLNIINNIIDISKIESGLMGVNITAININELLEYLFTFFKPEVENRGMTLLYKTNLSSKEFIIKTDRDKVSAILINLIKNAIKYSEKGTIEFGYLKKKESLEFFVKDHGIGIPKDRQGAIFERFIQADIGDKRAFQGAGLGLSISKAYVEMLSGKIWVISDERKGSAFYFTIPINAENEKKIVVDNPVPARETEYQLKSLKILIVEDDETSEMLTRIVIRMFSKDVIKARTGVQAIKACRDNSDIDLILMDLRMPEMNGYEATRQIRQFNKDVVIIAQTAYALVGDREKALDAGCNDYISKPIKKDELLSLIQKYMNK